MAKLTEAQKRAYRNYMERFTMVSIRMEPDKYESVQIHAGDRGESVNSFINRAVDETMERDSGRQAAHSSILTYKALMTAQAEARKTGEALSAFVERVIREASERPTGPAAVSLSPATLETAQRAADATGESVSAFVERAVELVALQEQVDTE